MSDPVKYMQHHFAELGKLESDFRNKNLNNLVISKLKGKTLLDIGCGVGHVLHLAKKKGLDVYGAEPDKKLIEIGEKIYKEDLHMKPCDVFGIKVFKKRFDNIIMIDVLEHIEKDKEALKEIKKHIAPGGQLVIVVPAYQFLYGPRDKEIGHFRRYTAGGLAQRLEAAGYAIESLGYWNMLGVFVYFILSKILKKKTAMDFRTNKEKCVIKWAINKMLDWWVRYVENKVNVGFGLSVVCVARLSD